MMLLISISAGCAEELSGRGYLIERVELLTGSTLIAAIAAWILPSLIHIAFWGPRYFFAIAPMQAALVALYLWHRRLLPCVIAHSMVDGLLALILFIVPLAAGAPSANDIQGMVLLLMGRQQEAIARFTSSLDSNPKDTIALVWRSNAYWQARETKRSFDDLNLAVKFAPDPIPVYQLRATRQMQLNDYDAALADINKAIAIRPSALEYNFKALIDAQRNDGKAAIDDYTVSLNYSPADAKVLTARGRMYGLLGQNDRAISDLTQVIETAPSAQAYLGRGQAMMAIGEWQISSDDLKQSVAMNDKDPEALNSLAWIMSTAPLENIRDGKQAITLATRACGLTSWKNPKYILTLASAYAEAGDFQSAVMKVQQAIDAYDLNDTKGMLNAIDDRDLFKGGHPYRMKPPGERPTSAQAPQPNRN